MSALLIVPDQFDERALVALQLLQRRPELRAAVWAEVGRFFERHPQVERTDVGASLLASIILAVWAEGDGAADSTIPAQPKAA